MKFYEVTIQEDEPGEDEPAGDVFVTKPEAEAFAREAGVRGGDATITVDQIVVGEEDRARRPLVLALLRGEDVVERRTTVTRYRRLGTDLYVERVETVELDPALTTSEADR